MVAQEQFQFPNGFTRAQVAECLTSKRQELIILPTEKCNFRCTYCYEDFELGRMRPSVVRGVNNLISRRAEDLEYLHLSWFGGEPLVALPVVLDIVKHAFSEAERHDFTLKGGFTTNGYRLNPALLEELVSLDQTFYQISLDGYGEQHDKTRRRADGKGTFDRIWANLLGYRELTANFTIVLRIHVSHENQDSLYVLCKEIGKYFGSDQRFRVDFQDVRNMGGTGGQTVVRVGKKEFKSIREQLSKVIEQNTDTDSSLAPNPESPRTATSERLFSDDVEQSQKYICYAAKPNSLLIRSDGSLGKCTVALYDDRNRIGKLNEDGSLAINNDILRNWFSGLASLDADNLSCPARYLPKKLPVATEKDGTPISVRVVS